MAMTSGASPNDCNTQTTRVTAAGGYLRRLVLAGNAEAASGYPPALERDIWKLSRDDTES